MLRFEKRTKKIESARGGGLKEGGNRNMGKSTSRGVMPSEWGARCLEPISIPMGGGKELLNKEHFRGGKVI